MSKQALRQYRSFGCILSALPDLQGNYWEIFNLGSLGFYFFITTVRSISYVRVSTYVWHIWVLCFSNRLASTPARSVSRATTGMSGCSVSQTVLPVPLPALSPDLRLGYLGALFLKPFYQYPCPLCLQAYDWDVWVRRDSNRLQRECVIPDVSRTFHFGITGSHTSSAFHALYYQDHTINQVPDVQLHNVNR